ncbi:MAG: 4Fe-4S binding protein [Gudongella sp.]|nr:4Fe-4S binding protein [Gudongella sp.]
MAKVKGNVTFEEDLCKGCGLCVSVCPVNIITLDTGRMNRKGYYPAAIAAEDMDKCIACVNCGMVCPDLVITVERL